MTPKSPNPPNSGAWMSQGWASPSAADWLNPGSAPSPEDHSPEDHSPADLPAARYRTGNLIGSGGMGVVRVAHDTILGRDVAFKQLHPGQNSEQTSLARLAREARITARLEHPGIVAIHDAGTLADGTPYYTMRLIRGQTLRALLTETQTGRARERFLRPLLSACEAVAFAHAAGMVHRDLKPDNILIGPFGEVQVVDWGLASPWRSAGWEDLPPLPTADTSVGTPAYMSPEQARGAVPRPEADVWALGATLYEVIIGRPAFPGPDPAAILLALREGAHPHIPEDISPELAAILRRAMAAHPEDRYPDAAALSEDLASFFEGRRVRAYTYSTWDLALRLFRAWRRPILGVTAALAILVTLTSVGVLRIESERERAVAAEAITQAALVTSRNHLSQVLVERAVAALREGRRGEAELRAVESLLLQENPSARGVLAAFAATPRARLLEARPAPACEWARFDPHNPRYLCGDPAGLSLYSLGVDTPIWRISGRRWDGQFLHDGAVLSLTEARFIELRDSGTGEVQHTTGLLKKNAIALGFPGQRLPDGGYWGLAEEPAIQACTRQANWLTLLGNAEAALVVCQEGSVIREDLLTGDLRTYQTPLTGRHEPGMPLVLPDQHTLLLTSIRGRLLTLDLTTGTTVHTVDTDLGIIRDIALSPDQRVMLAVGERGRVALWDLTTGNLWGELPRRGGHRRPFCGPTRGGTPLPRGPSSLVDRRSRNSPSGRLGFGNRRCGDLPDRQPDRFCVGLGSGHPARPGQWRVDQPTTRRARRGQSGRLVTRLWSPRPHRCQGAVPVPPWARRLVTRPTPRLGPPHHLWRRQPPVRLQLHCGDHRLGPHKHHPNHPFVRTPFRRPRSIPRRTPPRHRLRQW